MSLLDYGIGMLFICMHNLNVHICWILPIIEMYRLNFSINEILLLFFTIIDTSLV